MPCLWNGRAVTAPTGPARLVAVFFFIYIGLTTLFAMARAFSGFSPLLDGSMAEGFASPRDFFGGPDPSLGFLVDTLILPSLAGLTAITMIVCVIVFLVWQVQSHRMVRALGIEGLKWRPTVAAVVWFFPVANLILPHAAITELWRASDPDHGTDWQDAPRHCWIPIWWLALISAFTCQILTVRLHASVFVPQDLVVPTLVGLLSDLLHCVAAYLAVKIVRRVTEMQERAISQVAF